MTHRKPQVGDIFNWWPEAPFYWPLLVLAVPSQPNENDILDMEVFDIVACKKVKFPIHMSNLTDEYYRVIVSASEEADK